MYKHLHSWVWNWIAGLELTWMVGFAKRVPWVRSLGQEPQLRALHVQLERIILMLVDQLAQIVKGASTMHRRHPPLNRRVFHVRWVHLATPKEAHDVRIVHLDIIRM